MKLLVILLGIMGLVYANPVPPQDGVCGCQNGYCTLSFPVPTRGQDCQSQEILEQIQAHELQMAQIAGQVASLEQKIFTQAVEIELLKRELGLEAAENNPVTLEEVINMQMEQETVGNGNDSSEENSSEEENPSESEPEAEGEFEGEGEPEGEGQKAPVKEPLPVQLPANNADAAEESTNQVENNQQDSDGRIPVKEIPIVPEQNPTGDEA